MAATRFGRLSAAVPGETRATVDRFSAAAELSGVLRHETLSFNFTGHAAWVDIAGQSDGDVRAYEAYAAWQIDPRSIAEVGKRALRWGKGYAWSPVAFWSGPRIRSTPSSHGKAS